MELESRAVVRLERRDGVALVTLADPAARNALSMAMSEQLVAIFAEIEADASLFAAVVTGEPPAFCGGANLGQLGQADEAGLRAIYAGFLRVGSCPLPTVAAVNGPAVGAGINLALACDIRLASPSARFDTRFAALGLHPGGGHTFLLRRAVRWSDATALLLLGETATGEEAARIGLARACVPEGELVETALALAGRARRTPRELLIRMKASLAQTDAWTEHEQAVESELTEQLWSMTQPEFARRLAELTARVSGARRTPPA